MKKGWEIKTLGEVCDKASSNIAQNKLNDNEGIYPIYGASGFIKNIDFYQQENEYIAIVKDGSGVGRVTLYPEKSSVLGTLQYIIPNEKVTTRYIYYFLNSIDFDKYKCGAAIPDIYFKDYSNESIPIPPIKEQEEIVEKLDKGFELIDSLKETAKKNLDNAKELFQSVLREELSPKDGWESKTLGEAGTTLTGQTPPTKDKDNFGNYIPFVKPADFFNGELNYLNEGLSEKGMKFSRVSKKGSTLMVCIGATIGKTAFTEIDVTSNQQINSIYPSKDFFPKFIYYYLISKDFYNQVIENASQATLPIINKSKWESLTISFPKSIKEQEEIVNRLDRIKGYCEELEGNYKRVLELCEELKQGLLREAFSY